MKNDLTKLGGQIVIGAVLYYLGSSIIDSIEVKPFLAALSTAVIGGLYGLHDEISKMEEKLTEKMEAKIAAATTPSSDWED